VIGTRETARGQARHWSPPGGRQLEIEWPEIAVSPSPHRRWHTLSRGGEMPVPLADRRGMPESRPGEFER